ncbi:transporter substrate-binding domain-containing protein [Ramlibacter sp. 2FC]|uniref:substrate-binding periplasmic protein n=1 Tax=Ramlibacter sp. 2FC TaxID=2502188 RepID=UPI0010F44C99|nr:transporter substrate-binding domain-containing protein [Ramlibacter sp. 2FC]
MKPSIQTTGTLPRAAGLARRQLLLAGAAAALTAGRARAELPEVRERGSLKVALYRHHAPFSDGGAQGVRGIDAALAQALAERMRLSVQWLPFDAGENMGDDLRNMVWRGHYLGYGPADLMMQVPIDRQLIAQTRQVEFLMPYYRHRLVWLSRGTPSRADLGAMALDGLPLAAETGTAAAGALLGYGGGRFRAAVRLLPSGLEAARGVVAGSWPAAYVTQAQAEFALKGLADAGDYLVEPAALPGTPPKGWAVGLAIKSGQPQLSQALALAMKGLQEDGTLAGIWREHGLTPLAP